MKSLISGLRRAEGWIGHLEDAVAVALVIALGVVVNLQIFARYLFGAPFIWPEEVARIVMIWIAFIGSAAVTRRGADMAVDTFVTLLPRGGQRLFAIGRDLIMVGLFGFLALLAHRLVAVLAGMPLIATDWPTSIIVWPVMIGCALTAVHSLIRLISLIWQPESAELQTQKTLT